MIRAQIRQHLATRPWQTREQLTRVLDADPMAISDQLYRMKKRGVLRARKSAVWPRKSDKKPLEYCLS